MASSDSDKANKKSPLRPKRLGYAQRVRSYTGKKIQGYSGAGSSGPASRRENLAAPVFSALLKREENISIFWNFVSETRQMTESERIMAIRKGLSKTLYYAMHDALDIEYSTTTKLFDSSASKLAKRKKRLDAIASERLDRIAQITCMAEDILENRDKATEWLTRAHPSLNQELPVNLCDTELGARQVQRILSSIEWGDVA